jgi:hypothetical protein
MKHKTNANALFSSAAERGKANTNKVGKLHAFPILFPLDVNSDSQCYNIYMRLYSTWDILFRAKFESLVTGGYVNRLVHINYNEKNAKTA